MTAREVVVLNEDTPALQAAQAGDTYELPRNTNITGNLTITGTVDGRDVAADGAKLDLIEALADVTDTANVTAAGALMDSEVTNLAAVKAFDPTDYATAAQGATADTALQPGDNISTLTNDAGFTDDTAADAAQADATAAKAKTDFLTVTQPVDLDTIESRVNELDAAVVLKGEWDASVGTFPGAGVAQAGWSYIVSVGGTVDGQVFVANDRIVAITDNASTATYAANWLKLDYTDAVLSVAGLTGAVSAANLRTAINVEDGADVTDTANVTAAGALMDSEVTNLAAVKAFDPADYATAAQGAAADGAIPKSLIDAAGDLLVGSADNTPVRLAMGTALQQLRVNAGATALEYFTPSGGSGDFLADGSVPMTGAFSTNVGTFTSGVADGAAAQAFRLASSNTLSTAGADILTLSNSTTDVFDFSFQGGIDHVNSGASTAAHSQSLNLNWASSTTKTSSGQYSAVIGAQNTASASMAVALGDTNSSTGSAAFTAGKSNTASADQAVAMGFTNTASGNYSVALGAGAAAVNRCALMMGGSNTSGAYQGGFIILRNTTADATQTTLQAYSTNCTIPADATWAFSALIVGRSDETDGNDSAAYEIKGVLTRDESNNTALVGSITKAVLAESAGATAWDATIEADDTNEALAIKVTGEAGTNIRWVAKLDVAQVIYA